MSDFLDLQGAKDLNTDAIHIGAVANSKDPVTGATIDTHTNRSGGTDYTLQGFWNALGPVVMPWTSVTGGTLTQPNQAFLHPGNGNYYSWGGAFPKVVSPGTDPASVGSGYVPRTDVALRNDVKHYFDYGVIFPDLGGVAVNGMVIPSTATHLCTSIGIVSLSSHEGGVLSDLSRFSAKIGGNPVYFSMTISKVIDITENDEVSAFSSLRIDNGGGFNVHSGVELTLNGEVSAGYYRIFYGDGIVRPTYQKTDTVASKRCMNAKIKLAWFGVVGDVFVPGNYGSSLPAASIGDIPTGTDSTSAFKSAIMFAEWASIHGSKFLTQRSCIEVLGTPNTSILLKGDGIIKQSAFRDELDAVYSMADAGSSFLSSTQMQACKLSDWSLKIDMQNCHIFWQPINAGDEFISAEFELTRLRVKNLKLTPCGILDGVYGIFFHNRSATAYTSTGSVLEWMNSLGWHTFENCEITFGELSPPQLGTYSPTVGIDKVFYYTGNGRGDRLGLSRCIFNQFKYAIYSENPEAVEHNIDSGCEFRTQITDAVFFKYTSFYGQFKLTGSGVFLKGVNQTLLETSISSNRSRFTNTAEFSIADIRMEGGTSKHTLLNVNAGRIMLRGFAHDYSMGSTSVVNSCDIIIGGTAEVNAENCNIPGILKFVDVDSAKQKSCASLNLNNVRLADCDGIDKVSYTQSGVTYTMPRAINQGWQLPLINVSNQPVVYGSNTIKSCKTYGGQGALGGTVTNVILTAPDHVLGGHTYYLPSYCVIESIKLSRKATDTTKYKSLRLRINDATPVVISHDFASNASEYMVELLSGGSFLTIPTGDKGKRKLTIELLDPSGTVVSGGPYSTLSLSYRSLMSSYECPNSGLQTNPEIITF